MLLTTSVATEIGPFVDCTSNQVGHTKARIRSKATLIEEQADAYLELITPARVALLKQSITVARELKTEYQDVTYEELAVEVAVRLQNSPVGTHENLTFSVDGETISRDGTFGKRSDSRNGEPNTTFNCDHRELRATCV